MTNLSPEAKKALADVMEKQFVYKKNKLELEAQVKQEIERRLEEFRQERDLAVRVADKLGVPRTQIGKAIGTSNYRTVLEILEAGSSDTPTIDPQQGWSVVKLPDNTFRVFINDLGPRHITGSAVFAFLEEANELDYIDGDMFVLGTIYAEKVANDVLDYIRTLRD